MNGESEPLRFEQLRGGQRLVEHDGPVCDEHGVATVSKQMAAAGLDVERQLDPAR